MENMNISPALEWSDVPEGTKSFALEFKDVTFGQLHWAIWNIPGTATGLPAGIDGDSSTPETPAGTTQVNATFADGFGYLGPQAACNVYEFTLYALSVETFTPTQLEYVTLVSEELKALGPAILAQGSLAGRNYVAGECD
jgi:Raf kinase inhibitor-like YbhB/YbcL family protein